MIPTRLGPYTIEREIGRGGMGVVYLGRDPRLQRPVAIKVLPDTFARDPERLARFEREARLLAALTHPNIAGIYGLEDDGGVRFLALEYVEGETLAERIARGALPVPDVLDAGTQIASALEAAHEAGIVHRDLKPGNVKVTPAGQVKVLDFGLAKGAAGGSDSGSDLTHSPTVPHAVTGAGIVLGTAAYMSPEQARGKPVDRRTDIWSFGCVLYECLTGGQVFSGETVSDMIARILEREPDWSALPAATPEKLRVLLGRCLEKDAKRRLRDIGEARIALEEMQGLRAPSSSGSRPATASGPLATNPAPAGWPRIALPVAWLAAGAVVSAIGFGLLAPHAPPALPICLNVHPPARAMLVADGAENAISPDGRTLAFVASDSSGSNSLWVRPLGSFEARELPGTRDADQPFWSPDGQRVGFFADGKLLVVGIDGGNPETVCDASSGRGGSWSPKGVIVFAGASSGPLFKVQANGGTPVAVTTLDAKRGETAHRWPCFLPDGEHFLFVALPSVGRQFVAYVGSLGSSRRDSLLIAGGAPTYAAPGYLVFIRNGALEAQRFDAGRRTLLGEPFRVGEQPIITILSGAPCASASRNGVLAWMGAGDPDTRLVWVDRTGHEARAIGIPSDRWSFAFPSRDGHRATLVQDLPSGESNIWIADLDREVASRLVFDRGAHTVPFWSWDDRDILYSSTRRGPRDIYRRAADGSGGDQLVFGSPVLFKDPCDVSPDGKWLVFQENADANGWNLMLLPLAGGPPKPYLVTPFNEQYAQVSPDGKWLLYQSDESGNPQEYVQSFPEPGHKAQVTRTGAVYAMWTKGGNEIQILRADNSVVSVPVTPGAEPAFGMPRELYRLPQDMKSWAPSPDGERALVVLPAQQTERSISVVANWWALAPK
ncbi:MAG TPA: protein kinase [Candidatus Acidoferrales bacterium]|nr:protein kinase [Candidatus Acidoferrales bacterium]